MISIRRIGAVIHTRNLEFIRDRSATAWSILMPFLLIIGFSFLFTNDNKTLYKVGVIGEVPTHGQFSEFFKTRHIEFIPYSDSNVAVAKVDRHQLDMLLDFRESPRYWINTTSSNGYLVERLLGSQPSVIGIEKQAVSGAEIRYIDWAFPGILGLNMMFNCLFGVGYVMVRYRKSGFLKRLKATPLKPAEFLIAQMASRLILIQTITVVVFAISLWLLDLRMTGSYALLFLLSLVGSLCMISMGVIVAARVGSEELAGGLLNVATMPMMLLSGAWFSLEGSPHWVQTLAQWLPLTHLIDGARAVMTESAGFSDVLPHLLVLSVLAVVFTSVGAMIFRWN